MSRRAATGFALTGASLLVVLPAAWVGTLAFGGPSSDAVCENLVAIAPGGSHVAFKSQPACVHEYERLQADLTPRDPTLLDRVRSRNLARCLARLEHLHVMGSCLEAWNGGIAEQMARVPF